MAVMETRVSLWEALAGRAPGRPTGPADAGLWTAVVERLNPARARPRLRAGIEEAALVSARGAPYVMLRSPDPAASYLRLEPDELALARLMDGERTLARLVAEFARITGRLAPDQVRRIVADLAGNRMLEELPVDAFRPLARVRRQPWPVRLGRALLATAQGRRMLVVDADRLVGSLYRAGGRFLFTRPAAYLLGLVALAGLVAFGWTWWHGATSLFLSGGSYAAGAAVLLGLNVVALACHELGHGLAAKHAGRRVPAAGMLVYFGIPSVFVDTTDVWMAGRRARLRTTAAGPAAGLVLAGACGLVGLAVPELAPWTFKLAFIWYLNALFNLNPFLALDGYYLLMDWLEVPNLRARGLAWVRARLRPRWRELDGEGRLIALYGVLAVLWLAIAANLAYRIYADRVSGLVLGVWRSGWPGRLLLAVVVAGLAAPLVYAVAGWAAGRARAVRRWWSRRRVAADLPRRREVLRGSTLGALAGPQLDQLAAHARWLHPRSGTPLVRAGAAHREVLVVADGAVEGRRPGDPGGTIRQRVGPGGVVGLTAALAGAPAALSWHTAGTSLLAVPAGVVASMLGGTAGAVADRAEAEQLFAEAPGLAGLDEDERSGLAARARSLSAAPGTAVPAPEPHEAMVVAAGVVVQADGTELRRGSVLLPPAGAAPPVATARAWVRLWMVPVVAATAAVTGGGAGRAPRYGVHPRTGYPPLSVPPGPPPAEADPAADGRFERRLRWLVLLLLLLVLLVTGSNLLAGPAWSEMPEDRVLLTVTRGEVDATLAGEPVGLGPGGRGYLAAGDRVDVGGGGSARLTLHGGSVVLLCAGSEVTVGPVGSDGVRPVAPAAELALAAGTVLLDTASPSAAYVPATLAVRAGGRTVTNQGEAWYAVGPGGVRVVLGVVAVGRTLVPPTGGQLSCGDGVPVDRPAGSAEPLPAAAPTSPGATPTAGPSPTPGPATPTAAPSPPDGTPTPGPTPFPTSPGGPPTSSPPTSGPPTSPTPSPTAPANQPPVITWVDDPAGSSITQVDVSGRACQDLPVQVFPAVGVTDDRTPPEELEVTVHWEGFAAGSAAMTWNGNFFGAVGPVPYPGRPNEGGSIEIWVVARDAGRATSQLDSRGPVTVLKCSFG